MLAYCGTAALSPAIVLTAAGGCDSSYVPHFCHCERSAAVFLNSVFCLLSSVFCSIFPCFDFWMVFPNAKSSRKAKRSGGIRRIAVANATYLAIVGRGLAPPEY